MTLLSNRFSIREFIIIIIFNNNITVRRWWPDNKCWARIQTEVYVVCLDDFPNNSHVFHHPNVIWPNTRRTTFSNALTVDGMPTD